jgi:hypothetical protein
MPTDAKVVIARDLWRVVKLELPDQHGVLRTEYVCEMTHPKAKDRMGVQQWYELKADSALSDQVRAWRFFLDELLKAAGEEPQYESQQPERERHTKSGR